MEISVQWDILQALKTVCLHSTIRGDNHDELLSEEDAVFTSVAQSCPTL